MKTFVKTGSQLEMRMLMLRADDGEVGWAPIPSQHECARAKCTRGTETDAACPARPRL